MLRIIGSLCAGILLSANAFASDPAVVYDMGGKFDKSFNQAAYDGAEQFKRETGAKYREFEPTNDAQREQAMRRLAKRGANPIVAIGFNQAAAVEKVAKEFPDLKFTIVDMVVDLPNVNSVVFKEHEGSFLVGALASLASKSAKIGFVGGMDIPLIRRFACGYVQGAKHINGGVEVFQNMTGSTPSAWNDPGRGAELAKVSLIAVRTLSTRPRVARGSAFTVCKDNGKLAIGVDSNQNYLQPGTMLTSMVKRVDVAVYESFMGVRNGTWKAGIQVLGLKEGGVGWALDEHNSPLVSADMKGKVEALKADIIAGKINVMTTWATTSLDGRNR